MTSSLHNRTSFFEVLEQAFHRSLLVKLILSRPAAHLQWKKIVFAPFTDGRGRVLISVEYFGKTQTERQNLQVEEALTKVQALLPEQMSTGHLKIIGEELILERTPHDSFRLKRSVVANSGSAQRIQSHNRQKNYLLPEDSPFLIQLGISSQTGEVRRDKHDKFRQIQKFVEIIADLIPAPQRSGSSPLSVVDFGSGKHYLTFALHHFLSQQLPNVTVRGVEQRPDLVALGKRITSELAISNLSFIEGTISNLPLESVDLVVALHACNTATDDAIAKAVRARASFICVAPCCHAYVREHFTPSDDLRPMLRHGILAERFAESLTDSLRVLTLEALGYQTKLFEFISPEHTAKNTMITARFTGRKRDSHVETLRNLKTKFALSDFYLDTLLNDLLGLPS